MSTDVPNVLLIVSDQQHAHTLSALGQKWVATPNLDRLVAEGMTFHNAYCAEPVCGPSRAALMTGRLPAECGVYQNGHNVRSSIPNIGQWLRCCRAPHHAAYAGKWHVRIPHTATVPGFDVIASGINCQGQLSDASVSLACEAYLRNRDAESPFLLAAMYTQPHDICEWIQYCCGMAEGQFQIPEDELPPLPANFKLGFQEPAAHAQFRAERVAARFKWQEHQWRLYLWGYYRMVEMLDAEVGRLLQGLDASGRTDDTLVVFCSDHGEGLGEQGWVTKQSLYDAAARVPLIVRWPGRVGAKTAYHEVVSLLDIAPTIYDCLNLPVPSDTTGISIRSLLTDGAAPERDYVAVQVYGGKGQCIRSRRFKYIAFSDDPVELLFDMNTDPSETTNIAAEESCQDVLLQHRRYLADHLASLDIAPCIPEDYRLSFADSLTPVSTPNHHRKIS